MLNTIILQSHFLNTKNVFLNQYYNLFLNNNFYNNVVSKEKFNKIAFFQLFNTNVNFKIFLKKINYFSKYFNVYNTYINKFFKKQTKLLTLNLKLFNFQKNIFILIKNNIFLKKKHLILNITFKKRNFVISAIDKLTMKILFQMSAGTKSQLQKAKRRDIFNIYEQLNIFIKKVLTYNYFFFILQTKKHNFLRKRILKYILEALLPKKNKDIFLLNFLIQKYYIPVFFLNLFQQQVLHYQIVQHFLLQIKKNINEQYPPFFVYKYIVFLNVAHNGCRLKKQRKI